MTGYVDSSIVNSNSHNTIAFDHTPIDLGDIQVNGNDEIIPCESQEVARERNDDEDEEFKEVSAILIEENALNIISNMKFLPLQCGVNENGKSPCRLHPLSPCDSLLLSPCKSYPYNEFLTSSSSSSSSSSQTVCLQKECIAARSEINAMKAIVSEYEDAMRKMIVELQQLRATKANDDISNMNKRLVKELSLLEQSYSDLKSRFEDMKVINEGLRKTEELQRGTILALEGDISRNGQKYESLRLVAEQKIAEANNEVIRAKQEASNEASAIRARITRAELTIKSLESTIEAKSQENKELMAICDDLILKMDSTH